MSDSASATPSPGSTEQQTSWSARPCSGVGSSDPPNKKVMLFEAEVCCAMKKIFRSKTAKTSSHYRVHISPWKHKCHSETHVSVLQMRIKNLRDTVVFTLRGTTFSWQQTKLSLVRISPKRLQSSFVILRNVHCTIAQVYIFFLNWNLIDDYIIPYIHTAVKYWIKPYYKNSNMEKLWDEIKK